MTKSKINSQLILLSFLTSLSFHSTVLAVPRAILNYNPNELVSQLTFEYFNSDRNYSNSGSEIALGTEGGSFVTYTPDAYFRYTLNHNFSITSHISGAMAESNDHIAARSNSGLTHIDFGSDFKLYSGFIDAIIEADLRFPNYKIDSETDNAIIDEGDTEFSGLFQLQKKFTENITYGYLGYRYRDEGRSSLLPYGVGTQFKLGSFLIGGELRGFTSVGSDQYTDSPSQRSRVTDLVNARSLRFYAVNPSSLEAEANLKYFFIPHWAILGGVGSTLAGINYAGGFNVYVGLQFGFRGSSIDDTESENTTQSYGTQNGESKNSDEKKFRVETEENIIQPPESEPINEKFNVRKKRRKRK